jgi:hypothetical protein
MAGVTKPAPGGENPYQDATKRLALFEVEYLRLQRAKFLETRKAKLVSAPAPAITVPSRALPPLGHANLIVSCYPPDETSPE